MPFTHFPPRTPAALSTSSLVWKRRKTVQWVAADACFSQFTGRTIWISVQFSMSLSSRAFRMSLAGNKAETNNAEPVLGVKCLNSTLRKKNQNKSQYHICGLRSHSCGPSAEAWQLPRGRGLHWKLVTCMIFLVLVSLFQRFPTTLPWNYTSLR